MRKIFPVLTATTVVIAGLFSAMPASHAYPEPVTEQKLVFSCKMANNQYVTVPQLVEDSFDPRYPAWFQRQIAQEYTPLLAWTVTLASDHPEGAYIPDGRCQAVSARLTNLAASMGITSIQELSKVGIVNHEQVIFLSESPVASREEVIFTLKPDNRDEAPEILKQFQVGVSGAIGGSDLVDVTLPIYE